MRVVRLVVTVGLAAVFVAACANTPKWQKGAAVGGAAGAGAGAVIGHQSDHAGEGALIGAAVGAVAGVTPPGRHARRIFSFSKSGKFSRSQGVFPAKMSDVPIDKKVASGDSNIALAYTSQEPDCCFLRSTEDRVPPLP